MTYNFFADKIDKLQILEYIFQDTDLQIYDANSLYGQEICIYNSVEEISSKFDLVNGDKFALTFQLWTPRHNGKPIFRKIELDPKRCSGHTFRYSTEGWGLIQLYFGGLKNDQLNQSHLGHYSEKAALKWEDVNSFNGKVRNWDWKEIQMTSKTLKHQIHTKMAAQTIGTMGVLPGAGILEKAGKRLR